MAVEQPSRLRALVVVSDFFFSSRIITVAKQVGIESEIVLDPSLLAGKISAAPSLMILDLNQSAPEPVGLIQALKADLSTRTTQIIGFISHVQHQRRREAEKAGCDLILPRSVFSQNLADLLIQKSCHLEDFPDTVT